MRSPRSRNAAPSSPSEDDRCRAGGGVGGVATGDDAARGGIDSSAGAPPRLRRSRANGVFAARLCGVDVRLGGVGALDLNLSFALKSTDLIELQNRLLVARARAAT